MDKEKVIPHFTYTKTNWKSYRKTFFSEEELSSFTQNLIAPLADLRSSYQRGHLSAPEFTAAYIFLFLKSAHQQDPRQGKHNLFTQIGTGFFPDFINRQIRSIPHQINEVLWKWHRSDYPLKLLFHVPSLEDVLTDQANGVRCVTCVTQPEELQKHVEHDRDPLSFCLHDLRHAFHFFSEPKNIDPQIGYSRWMLWALKSQRLEPFFENQNYFEAWQYGATDMNTHPMHLMKYTKAVADIHLESCAQDLWKSLIPNEEYRKAWLMLNTPEENQVFAKLTDWLSYWRVDE